MSTTIYDQYDYVLVNEHVKPAVLQYMDCNQYGCIPNSSTTHALVNPVQNWSQATMMLVLMWES
jgi:hypothetical protein